MKEVVVRHEQHRLRGTLLSNKHISLVRQLNVAFPKTPATALIKCMTFKRLIEGGPLLRTGQIFPDSPLKINTALGQ